MSALPTLYYWGVKARGQIPVMLLTAGKVDFKWEQNPGDYKKFAPFGQLPVLKDGEITVGQSMAVARYCAKLAKLEGEGEDWCISEMMLSQSNDMFEVFVGAKNRGEAPDTEANWEKAMTEELPKHLAMLEGKITESGFFGSKMCAGDVAIASVINMGLDNDLDLAPFPKLQAMYATICLGEGPCASYIASAHTLSLGFKRPTPPPVLFYWGMKARAHVHVMLLTAGKVDFKWEQDPGDYKTFSPFGQLPFLKHGKKTVGQSMAVARYCARLANLEGEGADWATSQMMIEEYNDMFDVIAGAKFRGEAPDTHANWEKVMKEELPKHLAMLEVKITESGFFGSKMCAGDVAIASAINMGLDNDLDLAPFPKLQAMYAAICLGEGPCASYIASAPGPYFKRPAAP